MIEYITKCVLCLLGTGTIFYFAICIEEFIMEKLTGGGIIKALCKILKKCAVNVTLIKVFKTYIKEKFN